MIAAREIRIEDEAPPESGVRVRVAGAPADAAATASPERAPSDAQVLGAVAGEVLAETLDLVSALQPLQGEWLRIGPGQVGAAVKVALGFGGWTDLVPGFRGMDRLTGLMVASICR